MNNNLKVLILLAVVIAVVYLIPRRTQAPTNKIDQLPQQQQQAEVIVDTPQPNDLVTSPLTVTGRAVGSWYFEANLPVTLKDSNGNVLAQKGFHSIGDWMTAGLVDFNDTLTFTTPATQYGSLIISKDNPSGDPNNDASFTVPVKFW